MSVKVVETGENDGISKYVPLTDSEVKELGLAHYKQQIFASWDIPPHDKDMLPSIFMVLLFMDDIATKQLQTNGAGHVYEYYDKAAHTSINGYPTFWSCHILNQADSERIINKSKEIAALLDAVE